MLDFTCVILLTLLIPAADDEVVLVSPLVSRRGVRSVAWRAVVTPDWPRPRPGRQHEVARGWR